MSKESKAISQRAMVWPPFAKAIGKATSIKNWPKDKLSEAYTSEEIAKIKRNK